MSVSDPSRSFGRAALEYDRGRPDWPPELLDALPLGAGSTVLDLGAGTGKLTRLLAARYARVVAVEPDDRMRELISDVDTLAGTAEQIPLPDASVDGVFAAEAFHWFAGSDAIAEIERVLRPGGVLALFWNRFDSADHVLPDDVLPKSTTTAKHRLITTGEWQQVFDGSRFEPFRERAGRGGTRGAAAAAARLLRVDQSGDLAAGPRAAPRPRTHRGGARLPGVPSALDRGAVLDAALRVTREVRLTSADRVLFPDDGFTKGDVFAYYDTVADTIVPHLKNRPFTLKRYPHGITQEAYFQKQAPKGIPEWIPTRPFTTYPREGEPRLVDFVLVNSREALLWMVQMNCIDMNAWYSRVDKPARPDYVVFDLDPSDDGFANAIRVAHQVREALDELDLRSYVKTSGASGIHVLVPITRRSTFPETYEFAELVSRGVEERNPGLATTEWLKRKRPEGSVLVDHRQNGHGKTIASAYSVRPKPGAPVSTPLRWEELTEDVRPRDFGTSEALERIAQHGDLYEPVLRGGQSLGPALRSLRKSSASRAS